MRHILDWITERISLDIYFFNMKLLKRCIGLLKRYNWWIFPIIIAVAIFTILSHAKLITNPDNARYVLSAISQSLAAILALVFTITLVVAQMTRRYTAMDKIVFRYETIVLMVIFGIGIITPLLVLKFGLWGNTMNLSIAIASFCVFSLIPFLKGVNGVLKYDVGLENVIEEIMEAIESDHKIRTGNRVKDLVKLGLNAVDEFRDNTVMEVISKLEHIEENIRTRGWDDIRLTIIGAMREIGLKAAKNMWVYEVREIVHSLGKIGIATIDYPQKTSGFSIDNMAIEGLMMIRLMSGKKKLGRLTGGRFWGTPIMEAAYWVKEMDVKAIKKFRRHCLWLSDGIAYLWILGACATKYLPETSDYEHFGSSKLVEIKATDCIATELRELQLQQLTDVDVKFEYPKALCMSRFSHLNLPSYLEKFKGLYDKKYLP